MALTDAQKPRVQNLLLEFPEIPGHPFFLVELLANAPVAIRNEWKSVVQARLTALKTSQTAPLDAAIALVNDV